MARMIAAKRRVRLVALVNQKGILAVDEREGSHRRDQFRAGPDFALELAGDPDGGVGGNCPANFLYIQVNVRSLCCLTG